MFEPALVSLQLHVTTLNKSKDLFNDVVSYSGPSYIVIKSAKRCGSSAFHHLRGMKKVRTLPEFSISFQNQLAKGKMVMIITVDRGPDEIPRYSRTIRYAIEYFAEHDFDVLFVATNAIGRSAFNRVEWRMVSLSKDLSVVILPT